MRDRVGRPPKRARSGEVVSLTLRLDGVVKNLLVDQADAYGMSLTEYLVMLVRRDVS